MFTEKRTRIHRGSGFILIASLIALGVVAGVVVSLGLLLRVETRLGTNRESEAQSRRNARCALELALAHLQATAGPDQRFTARAEIIGTAVLPQPGWTGVWENRNGQPVLLPWLVSGNHASNPLAVQPASASDPAAPASPDEVMLVDLGTVSSPAQRIKLPAVPISSLPAAEGQGTAVAPPAAGHFAYWIGDEGTKASVAGAVMARGPDYDNSMPLLESAGENAAGVDWSSDKDAGIRLNQMRLPFLRADLLFPGLDIPPCASRFDRVAVRGQLPMVSPLITRSRVRSLFHSITDRSRAIFVDHGGEIARLRQDLSDTPDVEDPAIRLMLQNRPIGAGGARISTHVISAGSDPSQSDHGLGFSVAPVLTECLVRLRLYWNPLDQALWLRREVQAELWNPFTCGLAIGTEPVSLEISKLPGIVVSSGTRVLTVTMDDHIGRIAIDPTTTWNPGEILILKGHEVLGRSGLPGDVRVSEAGALPDDPLIGQMLVECPAITAQDSPVYRLFVGSRQAARYEPATPSHAATVVVEPAGNPQGASFGFGFALRNERSFWMNGARADSLDPRGNITRAEAFEPPGEALSGHPEENTADITTGGPTVFNASRRYCMAELPRQEVVSVGQLQHLASTRPNAVGNPWGGAANAVFDRFFFSTIPRWAAFDPSLPLPLPNPWIELWAPSMAPIPLGDRAEECTPASAHLLDRDHAAEFLLMRGAFNLNSTSVDAWKCVLAGTNFPEWDAGSAGFTPLANAEFRFAHTARHFATDPLRIPSGEEAYATGVRTVTPAQVDRLAESLVGALRRRGAPFMSIEDFVNSGILERGIAEAGINDELSSDVAQSPAWLTQADILSGIAPFIAPRSDTFLVRCYGDVANPATGEIEARSWCEGTVQRIPSPVPAATGEPVGPGDIIAPDPTRYPAGRRFVVTGFRWLGPADL